MKKMHCPICNSEIIMTRHIPDRSWYIGELGFSRADNIPFMERDRQLFFHCSNDKEHTIDSTDELEKWIEKCITFYKNNMIDPL
jgi:hypothetical protein